MAKLSSSVKYPKLSRLLHWVMAAAIIFMLAVGLYMTRQEYSPFIISLYGVHKSIGFLILVAAALRLSWRWKSALPPEAPAPKWQQRTARYTHYALYVLMFLMPLSGWAMSSALGFPVSVFGWFVLPDIAPAGKELGHLLEEIHEYSAYTLIALSSLHILAALYHHFVKKDDLLRRMWLFVFVLISQPAFAADWQLLEEQSYIKFTATMNGAPSRGSFESFKADFDFDDRALLENPQTAQPDISLTVDLTATDTVYPAVANELQKETWFHTQKHPEGVYKVTAVRPADTTPDVDFILEGNLTLKGKTLAIPAPVRVKNEEGRIILSGSTTVNRLDFGIGSGSWAGTGTVKDAVEVSYSFVLNKAVSN